MQQTVSDPLAGRSDPLSRTNALQGDVDVLVVHSVPIKSHRSKGSDIVVYPQNQYKSNHLTPGRTCLSRTKSNNHQQPNKCYLGQAKEVIPQQIPHPSRTLNACASARSVQSFSGHKGAESGKHRTHTRKAEPPARRPPNTLHHPPGTRARTWYSLARRTTRCKLRRRRATMASCSCARETSPRSSRLRSPRIRKS